ncbi:MAG TPA: SRPBCC family protein [Pseudonocardia sp.]|jgi:uncharacterized protein YndB with AHSA1/START domain|uniref:SRPBCC family protein n=1 Tax=Pseudonocardia sp. TaxID=60912 RepID=UPI002C5F52D4|nr:SRPBCC family protein [Pseudonocardia sp.]HTF47299.1 SRPBCC family protein [Pseudonocardia sp.]
MSESAAEATSPLGRIVSTAEGPLLEFRREYRVPLADLWSALTEPDLLARWIGTWTGEAKVGAIVRFQMLHEGEEYPPDEVTIVACEPPRRLTVDFTSPEGPWRIELTLSDTPTGSSLLFIQRLFRPESAADAGPGWHWYLNRLASALGETGPTPAWDDFYTPELRAAYQSMT